MPPIRQTFVDHFTNSEIELWLVLEEDTAEKKAYKFVFDDKSNMFGLAVASWEGFDTYLGAYGDFLDALESM